MGHLNSILKISLKISKTTIITEALKEPIVTPFFLLFLAKFQLLRKISVKDAVLDNIVIIGGGIGKPGHSTDSGAAISASDINADLLLKMSKTDGVYDSDPFLNSNALKIENLTFQEAIERDLKIMDLTAFEICKEANIPIRVFKMNNLLDIIEIAKGANFGSLIK